jgi:hypothetical protein
MKPGQISQPDFVPQNKGYSGFSAAPLKHELMVSRVTRSPVDATFLSGTNSSLLLGQSHLKCKLPEHQP